jgi:hypothetical protein
MTAPVLDLGWAGIRKRYPPPSPNVSAPQQYTAWLRELFPQHVRYPFAPRHHEFWQWVWAIRRTSLARPFVGIWPRGGAKTTSAELATTALGVTGARRYALYVRMTQDRADDAVMNIAELLESEAVTKFYPAHANRLLSKFGSSRGWRRNRVRTAGGFTVDAIGLDTAARGVKIEEQRPDLIILDDIDDKLDTIATTARKKDIITTSILPAGAENVAILAIQNLIIAHGLFTQLVDGRADFLADRIVSGPFPAIENLQWEWSTDPETQTRIPIITGGTATWVGQDVEKCERLMGTIGPSAFLKECQHQVKDRAEGAVLRFDTSRHTADLTLEECRKLVKLGRVFGGIDFGAWRFAFTLWAVDRTGVPYALAEYFSQRDGLAVRAEAIHNLCDTFGVFDLPKAIQIWGDAANPQDILELNIAWHKAKSPLRVVGVLNENKSRKVSVDRLNNLLDKNAFQVRSTIGDGHRWQLGMNAGSSGTEMRGSRLLWEIDNWSYPIPKAGEAQEQDPDDDTADGSDAIASMRYAIMSWWSPANTDKSIAKSENLDAGVDFSSGKAKNPRQELHRDRTMERFEKEQQAIRQANHGHKRSMRNRAMRTVAL